MIVYRELSSLEQDLGVPAKTLYALSNNLAPHYRRVELPKHDGVRVLHVPDEILKSIQRRIAQTLLPLVPISRYASAYRYDSSTTRNAAGHVGQAMLLKLDIRHFFDSVRYIQVKDLAFPPEIYAEPLRILLAMLCYYEDGLPQGAPTSPAISNIILCDFDETVGAFCAARGIRYTRYCDDMTFSGDFDAAEVKAFVMQQLNQRGFCLNFEKTRLQYASMRQSVTGIVVNQKLSVPTEYRRELRKALYYCKKFGVSSHLERIGLDCDADKYCQKLLGKVNYVLQIDPSDVEMQQARVWLRKLIF